MSNRENGGEINEKLKRQKPSDVNPDEIVVAVDVQNEESLPAIFKLNAICCDDLFEWLSIEDLHSLGQTCKRMHRLTSLFFQENFRNAKIGYRNQTVYYDDGQSSLNGFIQNVQSVQFRASKKEDLQYIGENCDSLREIHFECVELTQTMVNCIQMKLDQVETVSFLNSSSETEFYADFLRFCPNLKTLCVESYDLGSKWMCHEYPKLEHLSLLFPTCISEQNLEIFLQKNVHLQSFDTDYSFLVQHGHIFIDSKLKLDVLNLFIIDWSELDDLHLLLNELYDNGFYKQLECEIYTGMTDYNQAWGDQIATFRGLVKLCGDEAHIAFPTIVSLKELGIFNENLEDIDLEAMTVSFPNLHQVHLGDISTIDQVLPFIRRLPKLNELCIRNYVGTGRFEIDLSLLNEERKKLAGACKVTIYLPEVVYLETKMAPKNLYTNHDLIEIKRIEQLNRKFLYID